MKTRRIFPSGATGVTRARPALTSFTLHYNVKAEACASETVSPAGAGTDSLLAQ
jgi:hypothetical protein